MAISAVSVWDKTENFTLAPIAMAARALDSLEERLTLEQARLSYQRIPTTVPSPSLEGMHIIYIVSAHGKRH
jgi:hypothetical protein